MSNATPPRPCPSNPSGKTQEPRLRYALIRRYDPQNGQGRCYTALVPNATANMVPETGLEPALITQPEPKSDTCLFSDVR